MRRALQYGPAAALAVVSAIALSGARTPAFAEDTKPCYAGTPQECFRNEICTQFGWTIISWPPSVTQTCLAKTVEIYYWTSAAASGGSTSGGSSTPPTSTLKSSG